MKLLIKCSAYPCRMVLALCTGTTFDWGTTAAGAGAGAQQYLARGEPLRSRLEVELDLRRHEGEDGVAARGRLVHVGAGHRPPRLPVHQQPLGLSGGGDRCG